MGNKAKNILSLALICPLFALPALAAIATQAPASPLNFSKTPQQYWTDYQDAKLAFQQSLQSIVSIPKEQRTFDNTIRAFKKAEIDYIDCVYRTTFLSSMPPSKRLRAVIIRIENEDNDFSAELSARRDLYQALQEYADKQEALPDREDKELLKRMLRRFDHHNLSPKQHEGLVRLERRINATASRIDRIFADLPDAFSAEPEDRQRRAVEEDRSTLLFLKLLRLRAEKAALLGYPDYGSYALQNQLGRNPERVQTFLRKLRPPLLRATRREDRLLRDFMDSNEETAALGWGHSLQEFRRINFGFNAKKIRGYFPLETVIPRSLAVFERMLGLRFLEIRNPDVWHPDVRLFSAEDGKSGREIGFFYLDLYERPGKYLQGAAIPVRNGREPGQGGYSTPIVALLARFQKTPNNRPILLDHRNIWTFFHEFGHVLHMLLACSRYAGLSTVYAVWDSTEIPALVAEKLAWQPEILHEISGHWRNPSQKLPLELCHAMVKALRFGERSVDLNDLDLAQTDIQVHKLPAGKDFPSLDRINQELEEMGLYEIKPESMRQLNYMADTYGSRLYCYTLARTVAEEVVARLRRDGFFGPEGNRYRRFLERTAIEPPLKALRDFLGHEPRFETLMRSKPEARSK